MTRITQSDSLINLLTCDYQEANELSIFISDTNAIFTTFTDT